jgi:hypothetical protein
LHRLLWGDDDTSEIGIGNVLSGNNHGWSCRMSPARRLFGDFSFVCLIGSWESPPSIWLRVTKKPGYIGLVRDSRVRDWLWLGKVLEPRTHPT